MRRIDFNMRTVAKENIIVICTIVSCFLLTLGLCAIFSGEGIIGTMSQKTEKEDCAYAVAVGGYTDKLLARTTSDLIKARGGAGYIISSGESYEIIYAIYPDEQTAKTVLSSLGDGSAYLKNIPISGSKLKWAAGKEKAVQNALSYYRLTFDTLYKTSNDVNNGTLTPDEAKTQIAVLRSQIDDIKCEFYNLTQNEDGDKITEIKLALITTLALIDNICADKNAAACASSMRYALVQLTLTRQALMEKI